MPLMDRAYN